MLSPLRFDSRLAILVRWLRWGRAFFWGVYVWPKVVHVLLLTTLAAPSVFEPPALPSFLLQELTDTTGTGAGTGTTGTGAGTGTRRHGAWMGVVQVAVLVTSSYLLLMECLEALATLRAERALPGSGGSGSDGNGGDNASSLSLRLRKYWRSCCDRYGWIQVSGLPCAIAACTLLLASDDTAIARESEAVCALLSISVLSAWVFTALELVCWHESVGIFNVIVGTLACREAPPPPHSLESRVAHVPCPSALSLSLFL